MDIIKAIILGVIEGLTEFLPISSTGHLILVGKYLEFEGEFANLFSIVIQSGAILAVLLYFRKKVFPVFHSKEDAKEYFLLWSKVVVGIIPAGVLGILFSDKIKEVLFKPMVVAVALIVGAIILIFAESRDHTTTINSDKEITYKKSFIVGCAQCLAMIPGMSRSASTIIGGLFLGFRRDVAAEYSFFLAIPVLLGASLVDLMKAGFDFTSEEWIILGVGTFVSFVVAYFVIALFMSYIKRKDLKPFAYYRIILGILVMFLSL